MTRPMTPFRKLVRALMIAWDPKAAMVVADVCEERELYHWADNLRYWTEEEKEPQSIVIMEMGRAFQIKITKKRNIKKKKLCGFEWRSYSNERRLSPDYAEPGPLTGWKPLHRCNRVAKHHGNHDSLGEQHYQDKQIQIRDRRAKRR